MSVTITYHDDYTQMQLAVKEMRTAIKGSYFIKKDKSLLAFPSAKFNGTESEQLRYTKYVQGAEFPEYTANTSLSMIGKLKCDSTVVKLPTGIEYLENDSDGDGLSLVGLSESCAANVLAVKFHILLAEYSDVTTPDGETPSKNDIKRMKPRASIKQYTREELIDWHFERVNGRLQFTYMLLEESGYAMNYETFQKTEVKSYLRLALINGAYYQQKIICNGASEYESGDLSGVETGGKPLEFIPVSIVADCELQAGELPMDLGFLSPIADLALYRYRCSADYKECLAALQPMLNVLGVSENEWKSYVKMNERSFLASGPKAVNVFTNPNTKIDLLESKQSLEQFTEYFKNNDAEARARGAINNTENSTQRTATEILTESNSANAVLGPISSSIQEGIIEQAAYCAMFEGLCDQSNVHEYKDQIEFTMPREFAISRITPEEAKVLLDYAEAGKITDVELRAALNRGGWELDDIMNVDNIVIDDDEEEGKGKE